MSNDASNTMDPRFLSGIREFITQSIDYRDGYDGTRSYDEARKLGAKCNDLSYYMGDMIAQRGLPRDKMQFLVARIPGVPQAHTVLTVDLDDDGDPYVLDINDPQVRKLSERSDLEQDTFIPFDVRAGG